MVTPVDLLIGYKSELAQLKTDQRFYYIRQMKTTLIPFVPSHKKHLLRMMSDFYAIDDYQFNHESASKNVDHFTGNDDLGKLFMIQYDQQVVGYIILTFGFSFEYGGRDAFIDEFFIEEDFRNMGVGDVVLDLIAVAAEVLSVQAIHLEVEMHNENASKLYIKKGFQSNNRKLLTKTIRE